MAVATQEDLGLMGWKEFESVIEGWDADTPLVVASADLDTFGQINDDFGVEIGDAVLKVFADDLREIAAEAYVTRRSGDEFAVALGGCTPEQLLIMLEDFRRGVGDRKRKVGAKSMKIPVSIGIAGFPQHVESPNDLLEAAESAMQRAKREGGNRVAIFVEEKMVLKSNYYPRSQLTRLSALAKVKGETEATLLRDRP